MICGMIFNVFDCKNNFLCMIFVDCVIGQIDFIEEWWCEFGLIYSIMIQGSF